MGDENIALDFDPVIFRAYDIRGIFGKELTVEIVYEIAKAIGTMVNDNGQKKIVVGRDGRISSPELSTVLIEGLVSTGLDVIDIGVVPTPVTYFASHHLQTKNCVMITGSHNAPEYNGLKTVIDGNSLFGEKIDAIKNLVLSQKYSKGKGSLKKADVTLDYIERISKDIISQENSSLKIIIDTGNGSAGYIAPLLFKALNCRSISIYTEIDGNFPNHHPDPSQPENLKALIDKVKKENADIGFAFDGDGDRLGVVDANGNIIWPDQQLMLLARDILTRNKGSNIIFDVKCSRYLKLDIESKGGKAIMWKTGHSFIKQKMHEVNAPLAGEMSGHIFFKERWYGFDDALYTAARFIEIFSKTKKKPSKLFSELPYGISTPELRMSLREDQHINFMNEFSKNISCLNADIIDIDGIRAEYSDGWGLVRPSNTSPFIIFRFEGDNELALERIKTEFRNIIKQIDNKINTPF